MMLYVVIVLSLLLVVSGVWFLARPLTRGAHADAREQFHQLGIVRERVLAQLNELDLDERDHSMDADTATSERARLESELAQVLNSLDALTPEGPAKKERMRVVKRWRWVVLTLAVVVPALAVGLYLVNATVAPTQLAQAAATTASGAPDPMQMVARLERRLQENPNDVAGWLRLGRSYVVLGRIDDARAAFDHAYRQLPANYEPDSAEASWFLGLAAYNRGESKRALDFWQRLLAGLPPESDAARQLRQVMEQARKQGGKK